MRCKYIDQVLWQSLMENVMDTEAKAGPRSGFGADPKFSHNRRTARADDGYTMATPSAPHLNTNENAVKRPRYPNGSIMYESM